MLNMWSGAGTFIAFDAKSPKYADLAPGLAYAIQLINTSSNDVVSGTVTIEVADAKPDDPCTPDTWSALEAVPTCDSAPGTVAGAATIAFSTQYPLKAYSQCGYAAPCPKQFLRISGVPTGVDSIVVVNRLKRTDTTYGDNRGDIVNLVRPGA